MSLDIYQNYSHKIQFSMEEWANELSLKDFDHIFLIEWKKITLHYLECVGSKGPKIPISNFEEHPKNYNFFTP